MDRPSPACPVRGFRASLALSLGGGMEGRSFCPTTGPTAPERELVASGFVVAVESRAGMLCAGALRVGALNGASTRVGASRGGEGIRGC